MGRIDEVVRAVFTDLGKRPGWEICFADDFSDDGTFERLQQLAGIFPFRLLRPSENLGRGGIRNLLAQEAQGRDLVFLDGDCRVLPGFFAAWESLEAEKPNAENLDADGQRKAYLGKVIYDDSPPCGFSRFLSQGSGVAKLRLRDKADIPPAYFISQNFRVSRDVFHAAGGFRTDLLGWGGEDIDLGYKLMRMGITMGYCCQAVVRHPSVTGLEAYFARLFHFGRVNLPMLVGDNPGLADQFKLPLASGPYALLFLNPVGFKLCRSLITGLRHWPWPFALYRYVIFNSYARGYLQARPH